MNRSDKKSTPLVTHLVAGGAAGLMEACTCHPLDTIKVRMQLSKNINRGLGVSPCSLMFNLSNRWSNCQVCRARNVLGLLLWVSESSRMNRFGHSTKAWVPLCLGSYPRWRFGSALLSCTSHGWRMLTVMSVPRPLSLVSHRSLCSGKKL